MLAILYKFVTLLQLYDLKAAHSPVQIPDHTAKPVLALYQRQRCFFVILFFLLFLFCFPTLWAAEVAKIKDIRIADRHHQTRVVFDLSSAVKHHVFALKNPDRVVLDIYKCKTNNKLAPPKIAGTLLKGMRYAQKSGKKLRIVFDLNTAVTPQSFLLEPDGDKGHRLVIDLTPTAIKNRTTPVLVANKKPTRFRDVIIAIDAGHGGRDPGAIGHGGSYEKDIVLSVAKRLKALIDKENGMRAVLIRERDTYITLRQRIKKASEKNADIFISIHADAAVDRRVRGSSVYVLSKRGATSEAARILARRENEVDKIGGVNLEGRDDSLKSVLVDLSQDKTIEYSIYLAEDILHELGLIGNVSRRHVEQAGFAVLKSPDIPSVLVETAFISNAQEEKRLKSRVHQQKLAKAMLKGLRRYCSEHCPSDVLLANVRESGKHVTRRGETLSGIAHRYQVNIMDIRKANKLRSNMIRAGQVLLIPASAGT